MKYSATAILLCASLLFACSGNEVKEKLGLDRSGPDEFRVVSRPPLSVPPQFDLHPPNTGGSPAATTSATSQAQSLMTGGAPANNNAATQQPSTKTAKATPSAESQFLQDAGATQADPQVRAKLEEDKAVMQQVPEDDCSWWDIFCSSKPKEKEALVNPQGEAQRIKQNQDAGQPVTQGDTPQVKAKDTGVLGDIFGY